ncbi:small GTPase [Trypanosoma grayi]|uniref:small GTPase n=1 Tax=Trypanosoma grayi TaxID=71804 RepID=UPI0004F47441|nr:small GTPase [Trypanosoma grayi]KEG12794.1 small GTPase [Trypanosoma grayi]
MPSAYKVVLLGEGRVGKTSLISRFIHDAFDADQSSTVQASMYTCASVPLLHGNGAKVALNIWDTAGQERFHALGPIYYRNANGALLVYDITDGDTLEKVRQWIKELRAVVGDQIRLVICGNKTDREEERDVTEEAAQAFAKAHGALHFSTSAKTGANVAEVFQAMATAIAQANGIVAGGGSNSSGGGSSGIGAASGVGGAPGRLKRRGQLRIESELPEEEANNENSTTAVRGGGGGTAEYGSGAPLRDGASGARVLLKEDYLYSDSLRTPGRKAAGAVDLRAPRRPVAQKPSDSSRQSSCCA